MDEREQVSAVCAELGIAVESKHVRLVTREADGSPVEWPHDEWTCRLTYQGKVHATTFKTGLGHRKAPRYVERSRNGGFYSPVRGGAYARDLTDACELGWLAPVAPSVADVVASLVMDASSADQSFEDWCADLGYSDDSIKALDTYRACQRTRTALQRLFGAATFDRLARAEH
jgi:hypothetical protein